MRSSMVISANYSLISTNNNLIFTSSIDAWGSSFSTTTSTSATLKWPSQKGSTQALNSHITLFTTSLCPSQLSKGSRRVFRNNSQPLTSKYTTQSHFVSTVHLSSTKVKRPSIWHQTSHQPTNFATLWLVILMVIPKSTNPSPSQSQTS